MMTWVRFRKKFRRVALGLLWTSLAIGLTLVGHQSALIQRLDNLIYDLRMRVLTEQTQPDPRIVIVDVDEKSLGELGRWPWSRELIAQLLVQLTDHLHAAVVGFDVVFAEPQSSDAFPALDSILALKPELKGSYPELRATLRSEFDHDQKLADALKGRPVVLSYYFNHNPSIASGALPKPLFRQSQLDGLDLQASTWMGFGANLPALQKNAEGGFINPVLDEDGMVRAVPLIARFGEGYYQSLALGVFRRLLGNPALIPVFPEAVGSDYGALEYLLLKSNAVELPIPVDRGLVSLVNYRARGGPAGGGYTYVSASDVLSGQVDPSEFEGKIVLVGTTAPGLLDLRSTPVNPAFPGVEVHANVLSSLLDERWVVRPEYSQGVLFLSVLSVGLCLSVLLPMLSAAASLSLTLFVLVSTLGLHTWCYVSLGLALPVALAVILIVLIFISDTVYGYLSESRSKRQMVSLFGEYVAPELVSEMAENPLGYSMEGEIRELTVLFSDVRGFTSISEMLQPNELREYINEYLTVMSEIIRSHRGTLDKYIGDAIMAFWGAPVADTHHARLATEAAVAMQAAAIELNERFKQRTWPQFSMGVGVNTGQMRVGDMGSKIRKAYTVMGDAVNLGSRLEGITKIYGLGVLVGHSTFVANSDWVFQEVDVVKVKGKDEPVPIYTPVGLKGTLAQSELDHLSRWADMLKAFRAKDWSAALAVLDGLQLQSDCAAAQSLVDSVGKAGGAQADCALHRLYRDRIAHFIEHPPTAEWKGVWVFDSK